MTEAEVRIIATIKDIARLTGVSAATVSNVLNGKSGAASDAKMQEIFQAAKELHYRPNTLAKNLKLRRTKSIGIITEDLTVFHTPEMVDGIEEYCESQGYEIILDNMRFFKRFGNNFTDTRLHTEFFENAVSALVAQQVEGIVYIGYHCREIIQKPAFPHLPFVYCNCYPKEPEYACVYPNDEDAGYQVGKVLTGLGHTNIGIISGPKGNVNARARLDGFFRALREAGISYDVNTILHGDWGRDSGYENAKKLLPGDSTAIFALNDAMASGVFFRCQELGLQVGRDISLFGYDNLNIARVHTPAISSVEPPLHDIGRKCAQLVLQQIETRSRLTQRVLLPCTLHLRDSVCPR